MKDIDYYERLYNDVIGLRDDHISSLKGLPEYNNVINSISMNLKNLFEKRILEIQNSKNIEHAILLKSIGEESLSMIEAVRKSYYDSTNKEKITTEVLSKLVKDSHSAYIDSRKKDPDFVEKRRPEGIKQKRSKNNEKKDNI